MKKALRFFAFQGFFCFLLFLSGHAQTEAEAAPVPALELRKMKDSSHVHYLKEGKRITHHTLEGEKVKGHIDSLSVDSVFVDSGAVAIQNIADIRGRSVGMMIVNIIGAVISLSGGIITGTGMNMLFQAIRSADPFFALIVGIVAVIVMLLGLLILFIGLFPLIIRGKKYRIGEKWTLRSGYAPPSKSGKRKS